MEKRLTGKVLRAWFWTAKVLRLERVEKHVAELERSHNALKRVYRISKEQLEDSFDRAQLGCRACTKTLSISRRCMSPGAGGAPTEDVEWHNYGHAIVVGEHSVQFCWRCRGKECDEESGAHSPRMCGFQAALSAP